MARICLHDAPHAWTTLETSNAESDTSCVARQRVKFPGASARESATRTHQHALEQPRGLA